MLKKILRGLAACAIMVLPEFTYGENASVQNKADSEKKTENRNAAEQKPELIIQIKITRAEEEIACPKVAVCNGIEAKIRLVKEIYLPESWKVSGIEKSNSEKFKFTSPVPVFDKPTDIGITVSLIGNIVEYPEKGEIVILSGKFILTQTQKAEKIDIPGLKYKGFQYSIKSVTEGFLLYFVNTDEQEISSQDGNIPYKIKFTVKKISDLKTEPRKQVK